MGLEYYRLALCYHPDPNPYNSTEVEDSYKELIRLMECLAMSPSIG